MLARHGRVKLATPMMGHAAIARLSFPALFAIVSTPTAPYAPRARRARESISYHFI